MSLCEGVVSLSALAGAAGLAIGSIDFGANVNGRLPFGSPVFGAVALAAVVGLPMAMACVADWQGARRANQLTMGAGGLLVGWIAVEVVVIRSFSWLQPAMAVIGAAVGFAGYRQWSLTWGATHDEVAGRMPGDEIGVPEAFSATRAVSIAAPPEEVWPWLCQVGVGRAGFYSYDSLDNGGVPSSREILTGFQQVAVGDLAAPMTYPPSPTTSFTVASFEFERALVWAKADGVWAWSLVPDGDGTRLVVRLRTGPDWHHAARSLIGGVLVEVGDFPMMRKMLLGIQERAENLDTARSMSLQDMRQAV